MVDWNDSHSLNESHCLPNGFQGFYFVGAEKKKGESMRLDLQVLSWGKKLSFLWEAAIIEKKIRTCVCPKPNLSINTSVHERNWQFYLQWKRLRPDTFFVILFHGIVSSCMAKYTHRIVEKNKLSIFQIWSRNQWFAGKILEIMTWNAVLITNQLLYHVRIRWT